MTRKSGTVIFDAPAITVAVEGRTAVLSVREGYGSDDRSEPVTIPVEALPTVLDQLHRAYSAILAGIPSDAAGGPYLRAKLLNQDVASYGGPEGLVLESLDGDVELHLNAPRLQRAFAAVGTYILTLVRGPEEDVGVQAFIPWPGDDEDDGEEEEAG